VVLLSGYSLAGIGAAIGFYSPNGQIANIATQVVFPIFVFVAPVMVPPENLPSALRIIATVFPTTYIADAFRAAVAGDISSRVWIDLGVILGYAVVSLYLVAKKFDWRVK
jgi:ABC-2 type transport system permease protein